MLSDILEILPFIFNLAVPSINSGVVSLLQLVRIFRLQRVLCEQWLDLLGDMTQAQLRISNVALTVFSIRYVSARLFYDAKVDVNLQIVNMLDALYYSTVTLFTVGFCEIFALMSAGCIITVCTELTGAVLVPVQLTHVQKARSLSKCAEMRDAISE